MAEDPCKNMSTTWDERLPAGLRFMVTKTTKGRLGLIIGQHKFRKSGQQKDGSLIFRCSSKDCHARVNLDAAMRRVLRIRSSHNHPGRDLSDIISVRLPPGLISSDGQPDQEMKSGRKSESSKSEPLEWKGVLSTKIDMPNLVEALQGFREGSTYYTIGDGFYFCLNRTKGTRKFLKCFRHGRYKCMARASFEVNDRVLSVTVSHNHAPEPWVDELLKERHAVKSHATWDPDFLQNNTFGRFPGIEQAMPYHTLQGQLEKRRMLCASGGDPFGDVNMESHVERFLEQRLEHFADQGGDNHFDQHPDQNDGESFPRCEVTMNNQGGDKLHFNGYSYSKKAISANAIRWTCATPTRSETRCKGAITTDRERPYRNPRSLVEHNHPPEDSEASIMRDIARAKRRMRRRTYPHPFPFFPWMLPLHQMQEQSGTRDDANALEATLGMGAVGGPMDQSEAGPSGFGDDFRVKMEPEWVDAGALEPNCELEGQYDDTPDFGAGYGDDSMNQQDDQSYRHQMYGGQQQQQQQPLPLIPDSQDPVKLRVPGKPNLTITVAPNRQSANQSNVPLPPPPLHLLNPLLRPKRGRPRGSAYGSYNENDDRVTTILTDTIIASRELEKLGAAAYHTPRVTAAMSSPLQNRVKPRSKDPEAVKAAEIINKTQNRSGPNVTEELEKVHLKLRQEVLALEVQNLKAEREKLKAYRRNVAIRKEIMMLHLQLGKGIPTECASSGRGLETIDSYENFMDASFDNSPSCSISREQISISKRLPDVSISRSTSSQSPKISVRKSLQTPSMSPNVSPLSSSSSVKDSTPSPASVLKARPDSREHHVGDKDTGSTRHLVESATENDMRQQTRRQTDSRHSTDTLTPSGNGPPTNSQLFDLKQLNEQNNDAHSSDSSNRTVMSQQSRSSVQPVKDELVPLDSVSSDLSIEMLSEPGSSQWTNQSSAPMTEQEPEGFDDLNFEGDDSYDNNDDIGEFSGGSASKEPPDPHYGPYPDESAHKRRRVENMWEPDDNPL